jgi:hypothetical protein
MGRGKIKAEKIEDFKSRRISFKKRRISLIKKAMQLSLMSNCDIQLKIHWKEDDSLVDYYSSKEFKNNILTN